MKKIRVGSRDSILAIKQAQIVIEAIKKYNPNIETELITMKTTADKILDKTLDKIGGKGLFVKELDLALLNGEVDITVHSFKDLPMDINKDIPIVALGKREDARDVLIKAQNHKNFAPLGCASMRRTVQLANIVKDEVKPIRGNIQTRIKKMESGQYSGLVLAMAGIKRLGLENKINRIFSIDEIVPAACQGIIAVQARKGENTDYLKLFDCENSHIAAIAERSFLSALGGNCFEAIGAYCAIENNDICLYGMYYEDGKVLKSIIRGSKREAFWLGKALVKTLKKQDGFVALVGAGPSDRSLLTLKAEKYIKKADVVVYDRLVSKDILDLIPKNAQKINAGKESSHHNIPQEEINHILYEKAIEGKFVVRLKGGDPFVFGRGAEEIELLSKNKIEFEEVPGVTSAIAVPAYAGIPVTHRDFSSSVHIITGHAKKGKKLDIPFEALVKCSGTLIFLMGVTSLPQIVEGLVNFGMNSNMPVAVIENGCRNNQRNIIGTLENIVELSKKNELKAPAIIVVGKVCNLSSGFDFFTKRKLFNKNVIVTKEKNSNSIISQKLKNLGANVIELSSISIEPIKNYKYMYDYINKLEQYEWILFSSKNGVKLFFEILFENKMDSRVLKNSKIGVVGLKTAEQLKNYGIVADYIPEVYSGENLAYGILNNFNGGKILLCSAVVSSGSIEKVFEKENIIFEKLSLYKTVYDCDDENIKVIKEKIKVKEKLYAVFTSASMVDGFVKSLDSEFLEDIICICIGEQTAKMAKKYNLKYYVSDIAKIESVLDKLIEIV